MVKQQITVTCPNCGSDNVSFLEGTQILEKRYISNPTSERVWYMPSVIRKFLAAHCHQCHKDFEEELGNHYIPIYSDEI